MKLISTALVKAQKEFGPALKTSTNPHFRSRYADLSACVEAVIDALNNNGIALIQKSHSCDNGVIVETVFIHESGETLDCGVLHVPASKQDPQGYGSALTYARRYSLMAACGIAPEDDDGNAASKRVAPPLNPLDAIVKAAPKVDLVKIEDDMPTPGSVFFCVPGKDPIQCDSIEKFITEYNSLAEKVVNSKLAKDAKVKKLGELNEINKPTLDLLSAMQKVIMTSAKQKRKEMLDSIQ
jgi:hypothetical protein